MPLSDFALCSQLSQGCVVNAMPRAYPTKARQTANWGTCTWMVFVGIVPATVVGRNQMTFLDNWGTSGMAGTGMSDHGQQCTR